MGDNEVMTNTQTPVRPPGIRVWTGDELIVDNFAGGGGASSGVAAAIGRSPDIAINHDAAAIAMHRANHPDTRHYTEDVWQVDPLVACAGRPVALAWFSPTCTHFSKAKGTALDASSIRIRGLAWVAVRWAAAVAPRVICLENVEEFAKWGPLHRTHTNGCTGRHRGPATKARAGRKSAPRTFCLADCKRHKPIKEREGETFRAFLRRLERLGYVVEWRLLRACDYGAPTTRRRLFMVARRDGQPIIWPAPTHGPQREQPFRTAAECIDWAIPCPSIFERARPLADKTMARIARGIRRFVLDNPRPFIVPVAYGGDARVNSVDEPLRTICGNRGGHAIVTPMMINAKSYGGGGNDAMAADEPLRTVTASKRGEFAVVVPYLVHRSNGERGKKLVDGRVIVGQVPRVYDVNRPLGTIVAQGQKHALAVALLIKHNGGNNDAHGSSGQQVDKPLDTLATHNTKALAVAHLAPYHGARRDNEARGADVTDPLPTQDTSNRFALVTSFLVRYHGERVDQPLDQPLGTLTTRDRYGLVTVTIDDEEYVIADIGMRMLTPRELFRAQGFADDYVIDPTHKGKPMTKTLQIRMVGNSVPPVMATVIGGAQLAA